MDNLKKEIIKVYETIMEILSMYKVSLNKYIENKCGRSGSAQIPLRHGTYVQKYHQVNRH